jgi:hypothetical protein
MSLFFNDETACQVIKHEPASIKLLLLLILVCNDEKSL